MKIIMNTNREILRFLDVFVELVCMCQCCKPKSTSLNIYLSISEISTWELFDKSTHAHTRPLNLQEIHIITALWQLYSRFMLLIVIHLSFIYLKLHSLECLKILNQIHLVFGGTERRHEQGFIWQRILCKKFDWVLMTIQKRLFCGWLRVV